MFFNRTYSCHSQMPADDIKNRLLGRHVKIHNLDFEIAEDDEHIRIIPHAEQETAIKTLPITDVRLNGKGDKTQVVISSKMRKFDSGGPTMLVIFCAFMFIGAVLFFLIGGKEYAPYVYIFLGVSVFIFSIFWIRLESGYFDYVRKVRDYVKEIVVA